MEKLIVVRHGNYHKKTGRLTKVGEKQIEKLANFIKKTCDGSYYFASSDAIRAADSARILRSGLGSRKGITLLKELFDEGVYLKLYKARKIHNIIFERQNEADNLILVSHFSVATGYSTYFMQKEFGEIRGIDNVPMGKAVLVDIVNKEKDYDIIPH